MERFRGDNMRLLKKIWNWLFVKREVESYEDIKAKCLKDVPIEYNSGGYVGNNVNYAAPEEFYKDVRREGTKIKGGVNQAPTTPSSYSSYDSGSYSSSSDSGSSSSSCDSGGC